MLSIFTPEPRQMSIEDRILGMSDHAIRTKVPDKLRETDLFSEEEIEHAVSWLIEYRAQRHLDVIE
jgi:hypothetical protein